MIGWMKIVALALAIAAPATARSPADLDALATLRYKSAQTETVAARVADARLVAMRARITAGDTQLIKARGDLAQLKSAAKTDKVAIAALERQSGTLLEELARLKTDFTDELARRDTQYARDIAILQSAGEQLLATPDGARALVLYNDGGPGAFEAADAVLAEVERARDDARATAARKQLAADRRARAELALDARDKGLTTTKVAIERREAVVAADPDAYWDWVELCDLYRSELRLDDAARAANAARRTAATDREKAVAAEEAGTVAMARNDLPGAIAAFEASLEAQTKLSGTESVIDMGRVAGALGQALFLKGDFARSKTIYTVALDAQRDVLRVRPQSGDAQRAVMRTLGRLGDVRAKLGDVAGAAAADRESLDLARVLAAATPQSVDALDDEAIAITRIGQLLTDAGDLKNAVATLDGALAVRRALIALDPDSRSSQRALARALVLAGTAHALAKDVANPTASLEEALPILRRLAAESPGSSMAQRDLMVVEWKLAALGVAGHSWADVVERFRQMKAAGLLSPADADAVAEATARAEGKPWP
jgi:tetratricopeptide (TPR) repeat protein